VSHELDSSVASAVEARLSHACSVCGRLSSQPQCRDHQRGSPRERGYGRAFEASRAQLLANKPQCVMCGIRPATVAHHSPTRRRLVAMGVADPEDVCWMRPLCAACHAGETAAGR
jgi:hypothetical protein